MGGDQWVDGGGTEDFLDGGGTDLHGGDKGPMGGSPPPLPPILDNPEGGENLFGKAGKTPFSGHRYNNVFI